VRQLIANHPEWTCFRISRELARQWTWRSASGQYLARERTGRPVACVLFGAAAWQCADRDLERQRVLSRSIDSRFGRLTVYRKYGWCDSCEAWHFPADLVLGLNKNFPASPYLEEVSALLHTKMPSAQAVEVASRLGLELSRCFLHREALRQGLKAQEVRQVRLAQLDTWEGIQELAAQTDGPATAPFTLIIEIDAWNIRERDDWGHTEEVRQEALRQNQSLPSKWHWV
jgi:hypothetical protein